MDFDFDRPVDRKGTHSLRWEKYAGRDVIPLWVADMDFRSPQAVIDALRRRVEQGVFGYTLQPPELVGLIVERLQRLYRWTVHPDWIVFLPGVVSGLYLAANRLTRADEHILAPSPVYYHLFRAAQSAPRAWSGVPMLLERGRWVWDENRLAAAVQPASRLLMLCNPHNPGGTIFSRDELARIAAFAAQHDLLICSDEIHCDLLLDQGKPHLPIASLAREVSRRTVTLMAPSKTFNIAGAGVAFAIIEDAGMRKAFSFDLKKSVHDATLFGYEAAIAAYRDGGPWLDALLQYLRGNRDLLQAAVARLPGIEMAHVESTFLAWIDCSGLALADPHEHLLRHGLGLSPGSDFGAPGFVRLNFGTQRSILSNALLRLEQAVLNIRRG